MSIIKKGTYEVYFEEVGMSKKGLTLSAAMKEAEKWCGNSSYAQLPGDSTLLYGPGDGTTSIIVSEEITFV